MTLLSPSTPGPEQALDASGTRLFTGLAAQRACQRVLDSRHSVNDYENGLQQGCRKCGFVRTLPAAESGTGAPPGGFIVPIHQSCGDRSEQGTPRRSRKDLARPSRAVPRRRKARTAHDPVPIAAKPAGAGMVGASPGGAAHSRSAPCSRPRWVRWRLDRARCGCTGWPGSVSAGHPAGSLPMKGNTCL